MIALSPRIIGVVAIALALCGGFWSGIEWEKGRQAKRNNEQLIALQAQIEVMQTKVRQADEQLQNTKRAIDRRANAIDTGLRFNRCPTAQAAADSGNARADSGGRADPRPIDFTDVAEKIIGLGADLDICAATHKAVIEAVGN